MTRAPLALPSTERRASGRDGRADRPERRHGDPGGQQRTRERRRRRTTILSPAPGRSPTAATPATASASSSPTCRPSRRRRADRRVTGSITRRGGDAAPADRGKLDGRHDDDHLRRVPARQPDAERGSRDRPFSTATFTLTQPVDVPAAALAGTATDVTLVGDLTLHGVTKSVEIPAQAQLVDGQIQVAGSTLPARGLRSSPRTSAGSSSRSRTRARSSSSSTTRRD